MIVRQAPAVTACLVALLALTNSWPDFAYGRDILGQSDTASYRAISETAPGIPLEPVAYQLAGSMPHQWSWPGELLIHSPARFGVVHAAASGLAGLFIYTAAARRRASAASPALAPAD